MDLGRYSKFIGAILGNATAIAVAWLAVQFPSIAECAPMPDIASTSEVAEDISSVCTVMGFSQAQITGALMMVVNAAFVYFFPANRPPA